MVRTAFIGAYPSMGSALIADAAVDALVAELFPVAAVVTPNIPEAEVLAGMGSRRR